jgi:hypothetical protein
MLIFSWLILSGIVQMSRYPLTAHASASPTPVLPDVDSTTVPPGCSFPARSARSIMYGPMRSFSDPPGFLFSSFASTLQAMPSVTRCRRTIGVSAAIRFAVCT